MLKQLPNIITSLNLLCGCVAVLFAVPGDLIATAVLAFLGIFFDFFDGLAARLLNAQSEVGLQFDSLADMITSGLAPGIVMVQLLNKALTGEYMQLNELFDTPGWHTVLTNNNYWSFLGLLIVVASGYRLAKFNVDSRQTNNFIGLPTPANTILILSLGLIMATQPDHWVSEILQEQWVLIGLTILSCILLNAEIPLFALKFKTWDFKNNAKRYLFLLFSLVSLLLLKFMAIPLIIAVYIIISVVWKDKND